MIVNYFMIIGVSLSKPHTDELNRRSICMYVCVHHTPVTNNTLLMHHENCKSHLGSSLLC